MKLQSVFGDRSAFFSLLSKGGEINSKQHIKDLVKNSFAFITRFLGFLPPIDQDIARLYYLDGLSQDQIRKLYNISQAAVSRRLKFIFVRIQFLFRMPSLNPIQVREDLKILFPESLFEFAYHFYWELAQNRVKYFFDTSQSGAANKLLKIITYLQKMAELFEKTSHDTSIDESFEKKRALCFIYLDYFRFIHKKSNIITFIYKKNDKERSGCIVRADSILVA